MEDVLEVYTRPLDPARPMVCLDETSKQLVAESRPGRACTPGRPRRHDSEHLRCGTASVFLLSVPREGRRHVRVRERRTRVDFADVIRELCGEL